MLEVRAPCALWIEEPSLPEEVRPCALGRQLERPIRLNDIGFEDAVTEIAEKGILDHRSRTIGRMEDLSAIGEAARKRLRIPCAGASAENEENGNERVLHPDYLLRKAPAV